MGAVPAIAIGSEVLGAGVSYAESRAARNRLKNISGQAQAITGAPTGAESALLGLVGQPNSGQDSFLQFLRANPGGLDPFMFDSSKAFQQLRAQDVLNTQDQVAGLRGSVGSLGERFGTGFASREALLRSRIAASLDARNAGIAQSSFNTALDTGLRDFSTTAGLRQNLLQMLLGAEQSRRSQQLQALGFQTGLAQPTGIGAQISQTGGDISQLLLLMNYLNKPAPTATPAGTP